MMADELKNIAILNLKGVDCWRVLWNITRNDEINMLDNSKFDDKGTLWISVLVQIKLILERTIVVLIVIGTESHGKNSIN